MFRCVGDECSSDVQETSFPLCRRRVFRCAGEGSSVVQETSFPLCRKRVFRCVGDEGSSVV